VLPSVTKAQIKAERELVWLEDSTFAAWGCRECRWILVGAGPTANGKPPMEAQEAFDKHDCARLLRMIDGRAKRSRDSSNA
jgi:hypothetical protein